MSTLYCPSSLCVEKLVFEERFYNEQITLEDVDFNIRANNSFKISVLARNLCQIHHVFGKSNYNSTLKETITNFDSYENC
jgi:hypothetical protein